MTTELAAPPKQATREQLQQAADLIWEARELLVRAEQLVEHGTISTAIFAATQASVSAWHVTYDKIMRRS